MSTPTQATGADARPDETMDNPWPPLWAMVLGFFMLLVDMTIVTVATPDITADLDADVNSVIWVTSAYLLAYAVPILITGRLGDRFGAKNVFMIGLVVFTLASLWCGLSGSVGMLIAARTVQGLGAALMTPQTMAVITRIFPIARRGSAMALWGATAGVATLVGPILGGFLTEHMGWEWIFFINVPVGLVSLVLTWRLVPKLRTFEHSFDWLGVVLSGAGMFLVVFGIQEGHKRDWDAVVLSMIVGGLVLMAAFIGWQKKNRNEPLMPLELWSDRNFTVATLAAGALMFAFTSMGFPIMFYAQAVRGYSATEAGLLLAPMALVTLVLAKKVGQLTDRVNPRLLTSIGFGCAITAFALLAVLLKPSTPLWALCLALMLLGVGSTFLWGPLATTANRNLSMDQAGAGSGIFNATRQFAAVLGSAGVALLLDARLTAHGLSGSGFSEGNRITQLPESVQGFPLREEFSAAMSNTLWMVPLALVIGFIAVQFFERPRHMQDAGHPKDAD